MQRLLIIFGVLLLLVGIAWPWLERLWPLPGDIIIERENFRFYLPLATTLIVSLVLTIILWFWRQ